eukprot:330054_1
MQTFDNNSDDKKLYSWEIKNDDENNSQYFMHFRLYCIPKEYTLQCNLECCGLELYGDVAVMNQDILDIFREYQFSNYHFKNFTINDIKPIYKLWKSFNTFNFYPHWVIDDNIFEIFKYLNSISYYINIYKNENNKDKYTVKSYIKCKKIVSIYDDELLFESKMDNFDQYFKVKGFKHYTKQIIN